MARNGAKLRNFRVHVFLVSLVFTCIAMWTLHYDSCLQGKPRAQTVADPGSKLSGASHAWKLWHHIPREGREEALERVFERAAPYGKMLGRDRSKFHANCSNGKNPLLFGKGGEHMVCGPAPSTCHFISFGIRDDPSFDIHLANEWECRGFAGDPSITHQSKLHPLVSFHNIGLELLRPNVEQRVDPANEWVLTTMPVLRSFLGWDYLDIVKLDCEGCEVSLARDILTSDPDFLSHVGQISIETHATRTWFNSSEELYYFSLMFPLLEDAGFKLIWSSVFGCGRHEHDGCRPELEQKMGMSCGSRPRNKVNKVPIGWSCHDWLWVRA